MTVQSRVICCALVPDFLAADTRTVIGSQLELYGMVGPSGGPYTVQLDNGPLRTFNASREKFSPETILYQDTGLSTGQHTVRITNTPFSGQNLSIDYAVVRGPP